MRRITKWILVYPLETALLGAFFVATLYAGFIKAPFAYPEGTAFTVSTGSTVSEVGETLKEKHVIFSPTLFKVFIRLISSDGVYAGTYSFPEKETLFSIAYRFSAGITETTPIKVTIPEGVTAREIAQILKISLGDFNADEFYSRAKSEEGYLFPETYFFLPGTPPEVVIKTMRDTFNERVQPLEGDIALFGKPLADVVTMASILEREARKLETRQIISGILWKRLDNDIPLQVDAVFGYIFERPTYSPSLDDLQVDSPYNTYKYKGLPPGPISNPGLEAIRAAITPIKTSYLYYLTGKDGVMYYAKTFQEHIENRAKLK